MKDLFRLMRPAHWLKNLLILLPLLCSGAIGELLLLRRSIFGFLAFSLLASAIYIINDICDRERDRLSSEKCSRPIASGAVPVGAAVGLCIALILLGCAAAFFACEAAPLAFVPLLVYFALNLGYSFGLKRIPIIDVAILASGYLLRLIFGGLITGIALSRWLSLCIISVSFYMGLGKRRGEVRNQRRDVRDVLKYYSYDFLDRNMYMFAALSIVFYALWSVDEQTSLHIGSGRLVWTVPLVILLLLKYSLDIEQESSGDPLDVLLHDRVLLGLGLLFVLVISAMIYL